MKPIGPVSTTERNETIDVLRGFALFGIVMVNVQYMGLPFFMVLTDMHPFNDTASLIGRALVGVFFEGKFITLFSFLFGLGFSIFIRRAREKGYRAGPLFLRRLFFLALFDGLHAFLFWTGDILLIYALLGLPLMIFINRKEQTIKIWMIAFPILQFLLFLAMFLLVQWAYTIPEVAEEMAQGFEEARSDMEALTATALTVYGSSNWLAMIPVRLQELVFVYQGLLFSNIGYFYLLGIFLFGFYSGRKAWFENIESRLPVWKKWLPHLLIAGLSFAVLNYYFMTRADLIVPDSNTLAHLFFFLIGTPVLTAAYCILLILAYKRFRTGIWKYLIAAGRMSLTVYLTQTLVLTTVFYGYGAAMLGKISVMPMLLLACLIYVIQAMIARWWLQHFSMGPFEWLWRLATYGNIPALRKK